MLGLTGNVSDDWKQFLSDTIKEAADAMKINYPVQDEEVEVEVEEEEDVSDSMAEWEEVDDENIAEIIKYV